MNKKGISMVVFVIALAMVLVLLTATTSSYSTIVNSARKREFASEIYMVQKVVDEYKLRTGEYPTKSEYTFSTSMIGSNERVSQFSGLQEMEFYIIDLSRIGVNKLNRGTSYDNKDVYAVSKENGRVYYLAGMKIKGTTYYTLTDDLMKVLDI